MRIVDLVTTNRYLARRIDDLVTTNDVLKVTKRALDWKARKKDLNPYDSNTMDVAFYSHVQFQGFVISDFRDDDAKAFLKPVIFKNDTDVVAEVGEPYLSTTYEVLRAMLLSGMLENIGQFAGIGVKPNPPPSSSGKNEDTCSDKPVKKEEYNIPRLTYPNAKDWDALIPVPYHCLVRLLGATSAFASVTKGSALERDMLITAKAITDECKRTNNIQ